MHMEAQLVAVAEVSEFLNTHGIKIQKAVSEREKDWNDIEGVLLRRGALLDQDYVDKWLEQFAEALERPGILERYNELRRRTRKD